MKKLKIQLLSTKAPIILAIMVYLLLYLIRFEQGGWEIEPDLFPTLRQNFSLKIDSLLPSPQAELLSGILLGEKKDLPRDLRLSLRDTSTLHIVVVSGQNLSLLGGFFLALSPLIKKKIAIFLCFLAIIFYTLLTGGQIPVLRASIMVSLTLAAQVLGRQRDSVWVLIITASIMLLVNPLWIKDLSFQLSFLATIGVVVVAPLLLRHLKFLPIIGQDLAITTGAQLMVMPIIIQNFHQLSLVSIFTNLLVGWTVIFIMILGGVLLIASFIWEGLAWLISLSTSSLLTYFIYVVDFFSSLPFAWEYVGEKHWVVWVGYYLILGGLLIGLNKTITQID